MVVRAEQQFSLGILLVASILVMAAWSQAALAPEAPWARLLDNIHWIIAFCAAAWLGWRAVRTSLNGQERHLRRCFAWGLSSLAIGQCLFSAQVYSGWNPFPAPSDLAFLMLGPCFIAGFVSVLYQRLPAQRRRLVLLDVGGFALAMLALTLTLYLPRAAQSSPLQLAVLTAYPVLLLTAAATGAVMQLHLRQRWNLRWLALFGALAAHGALWMAWNLEALSSTPANGTLLNLAFSLLTLLLCWGSLGWKPRPDTSVSFDRLCEGLLRQLPLAMVALTSAAIGLLMLGGGLPDSARSSLLGLGLGVLLFAVLRQTQQLGERDRLLEAERVVAESQAKLQHLAHHDPLTGLPNLTLLRDRVTLALANARRQQQRMALMFIDLDQFKEVNDTLGHAAGDALLCQVAQRLSALLRGSDTVCRQGGDEFSIVLPEVQALADVALVAEKVMSLARGSVMVNGCELPLSMSMGVALYPDDGQDFDTLLQRADTAMYRAKEAGRNTYRFYDATMNEEAAERIRLRGGLARALERGELSLHYQSLVDLADGRICGAEALLRWQSAELGVVSPARFIPVAEDSGLIVEIGAWVLRQACAEAAGWNRARVTLGLPPLVISVNISVLQFRRGNLEHQVVEALRGSGLAPPLLELEITESVLMQDHQRVFDTIDRLKALGVSLAIDDFGTGFSSLAYVQRLRVGTLKIDRSFVRDALTDAGTAGIVRAVIEMARVMQVRTVAEGVETEAQRDFLAACRCDIGQGYWFARPMPPQDFTRHLGLDPSSLTRCSSSSAP